MDQAISDTRSSSEAHPFHSCPSGRAPWARLRGLRRIAAPGSGQRAHGAGKAPVRRVTTKAEWLAKGMAAAIEVGECLEWQGFFACKGATPVVKAKDPAKPPQTRHTDNFSVPRMLWEEDHGPIPKGKLVYRACCNNACVLKAHLRCGTRSEWAKARKRAGASKHSPTTKLHLTLAARKRANVLNTIDKAREVRSLAAAGARVDAISEATGVHPTMVAEIRQGRAWRELGASPFAGLGA